MHRHTRTHAHIHTHAHARTCKHGRLPERTYAFTHAHTFTHRIFLIMIHVQYRLSFERTKPVDAFNVCLSCRPADIPGILNGAFCDYLRRSRLNADMSVDSADRWNNKNTGPTNRAWARERERGKCQPLLGANVLYIIKSICWNFGPRQYPYGDDSAVNKH